jgi:hypothetical protein
MDFQAWLDAMPVGELRAQRKELERRKAEIDAEMEVLRVLERRYAARTGQPTPPTLSPPAQVLEAVGRATDAVARATGAALTPERRAIVDIVRVCGGAASPQQVSDELNRAGKDTNPAAVQTTMSRMVDRGQLARGDRRGLYTLPGDTPSEPEPLALAGTQQSNGNGAVTEP